MVVREARDRGAPDAYAGNDEEAIELRKSLAEVDQDPDNFESWEKLVAAAEKLEGGINRNSSSQAITAVRNVYDRFLMAFPLFFGYWKKYADLEFSIAGTEAAELIYERGVSSVTNSVDLWTNYCSFKTETSHDPEIIRDLFERGSNHVGLDFLAHPFWDKYIEFEERTSGNPFSDSIFSILTRLVVIPMHQYARYFEKYRIAAQQKPVEATCPPQVLQRLQMDAEADGIGSKFGHSQADVEQDLRGKIDAYHITLFNNTQAETTKRWTYESEIKRPYFHVTDLDDAQLENWRKYLDFEEAEGDYARTQFLYERCLVTCAQHEEFWLRYARWMSSQEAKSEEVRIIYMRAACLYVPIALPGLRLQYAFFEESQARVDAAKEIHEAILVQLPGHIETIVSLANTYRRHDGLEAACNVYKDQVNRPGVDQKSRAAIVGEWAALVFRTTGEAKQARDIFKEYQTRFQDNRIFWLSYLHFEITLPCTLEQESEHRQHVKAVVDDIVQKSRLSKEVVAELLSLYMGYLMERGTKDAAKEWIELDREVNGSESVQKMLKRPELPTQPAVVKHGKGANGRHRH